MLFKQLHFHIEDIPPEIRMKRRVNPENIIRFTKQNPQNLNTFSQNFVFYHFVFLHGKQKFQKNNTTYFLQLLFERVYRKKVHH